MRFFAFGFDLVLVYIQLNRDSGLTVKRVEFCAQICVKFRAQIQVKFCADICVKFRTKICAQFCAEIQVEFGNEIPVEFRDESRDPMDR